MSKTVKKFLSVLLVICTVITVAIPAFAASETYQWPVPASQNISSGFKTKKRPTHTGIDITGGGNIIASKSGTVVITYTGCNNSNCKNGRCEDSKKCNPNCGYTAKGNTKGYCNYGYGNGVIIKHSDGSGYSMYAHMSSISIKKGQTISRGTKIGTMGSTGYSGGMHLHFEICPSVKANGTYYAPQNSIDPTPGKTTYIYSTSSSSTKPSNTKSKLSITVKNATNITQNSAKVSASCSYSGTRPSEVSVYIGTSKNNLKKYSSDKINHSKNPFDIWYSVKNLKPGTTYYYQFHAVVNGTDKAYGEIKSFKTTPKPSSSLTMNVKGASKITQNSARVDATCTYTGTRPSEVSVYIGTSKNNMKKYSSDAINHSKNPFNIWYNLSGLKKNTTYYYQFHAKVNGVDKAYGDIKSFKTAK